jgi:hypothetical protein
MASLAGPALGGAPRVYLNIKQSGYTNSHQKQADALPFFILKITEIHHFSINCFKRYNSKTF